MRAILKASSFELATGIGEGEDRLFAHHDAGKALSELGDIDVGNAGIEGDELELPGLVGYAAGDLGAAVADLAGAEMAAGVEKPVAVLVEDIGALAADDHLGISGRILALEGGEIREEMADMPLGAIAGGLAVHRRGWGSGHA